MSSRFSPSPRAKFIRNLLGLTAAAAFTLVVFLLIAAFNGALKVINEITNSMPLRCPDGYDLIAAEDGSPNSPSTARACSAVLGSMNTVG